MEEKTSRGGEKASRRNNSVCKVSFRWELRDGPVALWPLLLTPRRLQAILKLSRNL